MLALAATMSCSTTHSVTGIDQDITAVAQVHPERAASLIEKINAWTSIFENANGTQDPGDLTGTLGADADLAGPVTLVAALIDTSGDNTLDDWLGGTLTDGSGIDLQTGGVTLSGAANATGMTPQLYSILVAEVMAKIDAGSGYVADGTLGVDTGTSTAPFNVQAVWDLKYARANGRSLTEHIGASTLVDALDAELVKWTNGSYDPTATA